MMELLANIISVNPLASAIIVLLFIMVIGGLEMNNDDSNKAIYTVAAPIPRYEWQKRGLPITTYKLRLMTEQQANEHGMLEQYRICRRKLGIDE